MFSDVDPHHRCRLLVKKKGTASKAVEVVQMLPQQFGRCSVLRAVFQQNGSFADFIFEPPDYLADSAVRLFSLLL